MRVGYSQRLRVGLAVVGSVATALGLGVTTSASAHIARPAAAEPQCAVHAPAPFVEAGLFNTHSSVAGVINVQCRPVYAEQKVTISADELNSRCNNTLSWSTPPPARTGTGQQFDVYLDDNGEAEASFWGGPSCAAGKSVITASLDTAPFTTVTTTFTVQSPRNTPPGVTALPSSAVEDSINSSVETVIYVEFPSVYSEQQVKIQAVELDARCTGGVTWIGPGGPHQGGDQPTGNTTFVTLDNNGNAFVVAEAGPSCASGPSLIEASLVNTPFTTYTTTFTVLSPRATCTSNDCD